MKLILLAVALIAFASGCGTKHGALVGPRYTQNAGTDSSYVVQSYTLRQRPQGPTIIIKTDP